MLDAGGSGGGSGARGRTVTAIGDLQVVGRTGGRAPALTALGFRLPGVGRRVRGVDRARASVWRVAARVSRVDGSGGQHGGGRLVDTDSAMQNAMTQTAARGWANVGRCMSGVNQPGRRPTWAPAAVGLPARAHRAEPVGRWPGSARGAGAATRTATGRAVVRQPARCRIQPVPALARAAPRRKGRLPVPDGAATARCRHRATVHLLAPSGPPTVGVAGSRSSSRSRAAKRPLGRARVRLLRRADVPPRLGPPAEDLYDERWSIRLAGSSGATGALRERRLESRSGAGKNSTWRRTCSASSPHS